MHKLCNSSCSYYCSLVTGQISYMYVVLETGWDTWFDFDQKRTGLVEFEINTNEGLTLPFKGNPYMLVLC